MAKSKSFFGLRTGSTKSLTFQVYRGQQITKDRVTRISNPRTESQMVQRALIPIVAASRAALKGLVDHSFEGVAYGDQSLKMFSSLNLKAGALTVASYPPNGYSNPGFANLIVSRGTINVDFDIQAAGGSAVAMFGTNAETMTHKAYDAGAPAAGLLRELAVWSATTGHVSVFDPGTQLTFLSLIQSGSLDEPKAALSAFNISRILFPGDNTLNTQLEDVNGPWKIKETIAQNANSFILTNSQSDELYVYLDHGFLSIQVTPGDSAVHGMAVIVSKYVNNQWRRNNARIVLTSDPDPIYTYAQWRATYEKTGASAKYLNQGSEGSGIA